MNRREREINDRLKRRAQHRAAQLAAGGKSRYGRKRAWLANSDDGNGNRLRGFEVPHPKPWK